MARHYAHVKFGIVDRVCVFGDHVEEFVNPDDPVGEWIETFENADGTRATRYNFAHPDAIWIEGANAFHSPKPYEGWTLNTDNYTWEAPFAKPEDDGTILMAKLGGPDAQDPLEECRVVYSWDPSTNDWRRKLVRNLI